MDKNQRIYQLDKSDMNSDFTGDTAAGLSDGSLFYFKDEETRAWERSLFAPEPGINLSDRKEQKEALNLLWKSDLPASVSAAPLPKSSLTQQAGSGEDPEGMEPDQNSLSRQSSSGRKCYSSGNSHANGTSNTGRKTSRSAKSISSRASGKTSAHNSAWEILRGNEPIQNPRGSMRTRPPKHGKAGMFSILVLTVILSSLIVLIAFFFIKYSSDTDTGGTGMPDIFFGGSEETGGNDVLTEFGDNYSDFYTSKYIASYEAPGDEAKYQELCVINPETFFGTASHPASTNKLYYSDIHPTWLSLAYINTDSFLNCGYTIMYAAPDTASPYSIPDNMLPPQLADQGGFFEKVVKDFTNPESYFRKNYNDYKIGKIQRTKIGEHEISYLEVTYKDEANREIFDVYSFEQKPLGAAFITECRCEKGEVENGIEALSNLYGMLTFHIKDFEFIDASRFLFSRASVFDNRNHYCATIDVSDLGDLKHSDIIYKNLAHFHIGEYGSHGAPMLQIEINYLSYSSVDDLGGFEKWIDNALETENDRGNYVEPAIETGRGRFTYEDNTVFYLSMSGTEKIRKSAEDVALYKYRIETPDSEIILDLRFEHDVPEGLDPETFLKDHISVSKVD